MERNNDLSIEHILAKNLYLDKDFYRVNISKKSDFVLKIRYKYSDLYISSDKDISDIIKQKIIDFYDIIENEIKENPVFEKSLMPITTSKTNNPLIEEMCRQSLIFNVGPMASVAGSLCHFIGQAVNKNVKYLIIENGGDVYIRSQNDVVLSVFLKSDFYKDGLQIRIRKDLLPCGVASSSGTFGHSLSLGKSDIALVIARNAITADAAATSFGNLIKDKEDLKNAVTLIKEKEGILGLLAAKDEKLALFGQIELL